MSPNDDIDDHDDFEFVLTLIARKRRKIARKRGFN